MTVSELIQKLSACPASASVHVCTDQVAGIVLLGETGDNLGIIEVSMYDQELPPPEPEPEEAEEETA